MTNSLIPYSFTPGTKAKAQEVNANFIALADEITENSKRIETNKATAAENIDKCLAKDGNASLSGTKKFKSLDGIPLVIQHAEASMTNIPAGGSLAILDIQDSDGTRVGCLYNQILPNGALQTCIQTIKDDTYNTFSLYIDENKSCAATINGEIIRYVKESYWDGSSWYRLWSDGWIEQGGKFTNVDAYQSTVIALLKAHASSNYGIFITQGGFNSDATRSSIGILNVVPNAFAVGFGNGTNAFGSWMTCGF